jgi:hypothetical protein
MSNYNTDYAPRAIDVKQRLKAMHDAFLKGNYEEAVVNGNAALVELRLAVVAIKSLCDNQKLRE